MKYYQQALLNFKNRDSTIEEQEIWNEQELKPWADKQLGIVGIMSFVQVGMFGLMLLAFWVTLNSLQMKWYINLKILVLVVEVHQHIILL